MMNLPKSALFLIILLFFTNCDFSFFDTPGIEPMKLSGKLALQGSNDYSDVFIWADAFNIKSWSDENGNYEMELPPPANQGYGSGFNGYLTLFFFRENYLSDSLQIQFSNGYLSDNQTVVDKSGKIQETISLPQLYKSEFHFESGTVDIENGVNFLPIDESVELQLEISNLSEIAHEFYLSFCNNIWPETGFSNNGMYLNTLESSELPIFAVSPESFTAAIFFLPTEKRIYKCKIRIRKQQDTENFLFQQLSSGGYVLSEMEFSSENIILKPFVRARHKELPLKVFAALDTNLIHYRPDATFFLLRSEIPELQIQISDSE